MVNLNRLNRWRFTKEFLDEVKRQVDKGLKWHPFVREYKPTVKKGRVYVGKLPIVGEHEVDKYIKHLVLQTGAPTGIESLAHYAGHKFAYGISRGDVRRVLGADKVFQSQQRRGDRPVGKKYKKEGRTAFKFRKDNVLGVDLIEVGKKFDASYLKGTKYLLVAVHAYTGHVYIRRTPNKEAATILKAFRGVYAKATRHFGKITLVERDDGGEFKNAQWDAFRKEKGLGKRGILRKVNYVEAKNSQVSRTLHLIKRGHSFERAIELTEKKLNNTPNRTLGGLTPREAKGHDFKKIKKKFKRYKQGVSNKVRKFKPGDKVHYLLKSKQERGNTVAYKSFMRHWSSSVHEVLKKVGKKYRVNDIPYTLHADELQLVRKVKNLTTIDKEREAEDLPEVIAKQPVSSRDMRAARKSRRKTKA